MLNTLYELISLILDTTLGEKYYNGHIFKWTENDKALATHPRPLCQHVEVPGFNLGLLSPMTSPHCPSHQIPVILRKCLCLLINWSLRMCTLQKPHLAYQFQNKFFLPSPLKGKDSRLTSFIPKQSLLVNIFFRLHKISNLKPSLNPPPP